MVLFRRHLSFGVISTLISCLLPLCLGETPTYQSSFNLGIYCSPNSNIKLACSEGVFSHRSGTIQLRGSVWYPRSSCNTTVEVDTRLCPSKKFAIYFNIKHLNLRSTDSINIFEKDILGKVLPGDNHEVRWTRPTSVGQFLSSFSKQPALNFVFQRDESSTESIDGYEILTLDYTVVGESRDDDSYYEETHCAALRGYMPSKFFCDEQSDRVNCPSSYPYPPNAHELSPATGTALGWLGQCDQYTTYRPPRWPTASSYEGTYDGYHLEWYQIGAIVCVSLALFIAIIRALIYMCCTRPAAHTIMRSHPVITGPQYPNPNGGAPPPSFASIQAPGSGSYMGAPPEYTSVFPTGPISETTQDPPKY